jgi:hypothetical protein
MPPFHHSPFAGYSLREAGIISVALGDDYNWISAVIDGYHHPGRHRFDVFIDARGQKPLKTKDCPSRRCANSYRQRAMRYRMLARIIRCKRPIRLRTYCFGAIPWLMHDQPFVRGWQSARRLGSDGKSGRETCIGYAQKVTFMEN